MNEFYVYEHWRPDTNECFYVGKGKGSRAYDMNRRNNAHKEITKNLLRNGILIEIKIFAFNLSESYAFRLEAERINFWVSKNVKLTNMLIGKRRGPFKRKHSKETRRKITEARRSQEKKLKESSMQSLRQVFIDIENQARLKA